MTRIFASVTGALALSLLTACAVPVQAPPPGGGGGFGNAPVYGPQVEYGRVQSVDLVRAESQTTGGGALLGGLVGAVVGRQIGSGSGRTAGTIVGAAGGAIIGNQIEKQQRGAQDVWRVVIQTDQGALRSFDYAQPAELRVGDRVRIAGNQVMRY